MRNGIDAVVFDLGGVLIDWDPRHLYRKLFPGDEAGMERFLAEVVTPQWNQRQDTGRPWSVAIEELVAEHPDQRELIEAFRARWPETLRGPIQASVDILAELRRIGLGLYALTNWSAETFALARPMFPFLAWFRGIVVSGEEGIGKPEPEIFRRLLDRYGLRADRTLFIDDVAVNVEAAARLGMRALAFVDPARLRRDLAALGLVDAAEAGPGGRGRAEA
jgi:2-haloacid dehalogenase